MWLGSVIYVVCSYAIAFDGACIFDASAASCSCIFYSHHIWLRDHCRCPRCFHPVTKQRLVNTFEVRIASYSGSSIFSIQDVFFKVDPA